MIEIPGYRIIRELGRGGMATVWLALQQSVDREVALKIMSPGLLADPNFGERFLREARIAAKLHHRHVVGVHDVGRHHDIHFIAMEYLAGGAFKVIDGQPRAPTEVLRVVREIAMALGYAHRKGFIHRDVKPDNILLHDDGSAALTDFGIARANDSATRMTRTGAVIGTPYYMSPEQARGRPLDGRADLYSLGVVLFELLTGRLPFVADDPLAVGIMHITEPVPRLPPMLAPLTALVERMLAKTPEERFQSGEELAAAVHTLELDIADGRWPELGLPDEHYRRRIRAESAHTMPLPATTTPSTPVLGRSESALARAGTEIGADREGGKRAEPILGRVDQMGAFDTLPGRHRPRPATPRRHRVGWALLGMALLLGIAGWLAQDRLRALLPRSEVATALEQAQAAVAAGRLAEGSDSARSLYESVLRLDPDNSMARTGLQSVGAALLVQAEAALDRDDLVRARAIAGSARAVLGGGQALDTLERRLREREGQSERIGELLDAARAAQAAARWDGPEGAIALYQRILVADADNAVASKGLRDVLEAMTVVAGAALDQGDLASARSLADRIASVSGDYASLPGLRARLAEAQALAKQRIQQDLARADALLKQGALDQPDGNNALALYREVLRRDPDNLPAAAGIRQVVRALLAAVERALAAGDLEAARKHLDKARSLDAGAAGLARLANRLRDAKERHEIAAERAQVDPQRQATVQKLLDEAALLSARGELIDPPGANAFDKYRSAQAIDPNNAEAKSGLDNLPDRAKVLFESAIGEQHHFAASSYLSVVGQLAPNDAALPTMRQRLAEAYLKQALAEQQAGKPAAA
ncbi:MAG: protein kinase, partial [Lysobacterales bacterium]